MQFLNYVTAGYIASGDEPKNKFGEMTDGEIVVLFFYV